MGVTFALEFFMDKLGHSQPVLFCAAAAVAARRIRYHYMIMVYLFFFIYLFIYFRIELTQNFSVKFLNINVTKITLLNQI